MPARFRCALVGLTAATLALVGPAAGGGGRGPLVVAFSSPLAPKATARFVDLGGHDVGTVALPQRPAQAAQTGVEGRVAVVGENGSVLLVDTAARKVIPVRMPGNAPIAEIDAQFSGGKRYLVLQRSSQAPVALLDAATGATSDISRIDPSSAPVDGYFAPGGKTLIAIAPQASWLVPCTHPAAAVRLPNSWSVFGSFSADGSRVAFVDRTHPAKPLVEIMDADGTHRRALDPRVPGLSLASFLPDGRLLLVGAAGIVSESADGTGRRTVGAGVSGPAQAVVDPGGRGAAVDVTDTAGGGDRWTWLDLRGRHRAVPALNGFTLLTGATAGRFAYLKSSIQNANGSQRTLRIAVLDLATGIARVALTVAGTEDYQGFDVANYGHGVLVQSQTPQAARLRLVPAAGPAREIASGSVAYGSFSIDGTWVAVSSEAGRGPVKLRLVPVSGGNPVDAGTGVTPTWTP